MPKFSYICRKKSGAKEAGVIEGPTQDDVVAQLQKKGLFVTSIISFDALKKDTAALQERKAPRKQFSHSRITGNDLVTFSRQLSMLLAAGISLLRALDVVLKQVDSRDLSITISQVRQDMEGGKTFRDSLAKFPKVFSSLWINLIETGEASGNLPMVLDKLAHYLEESANFRRKIISAMVYPGILLFVSVSAVFFFIVKIVPTFSNLLSNFGVELPLATRIIIAISDFLTKRFFVLFLFGAGAVFLFQNLKKQPAVTRMLEELSLKLPVFGDFSRYMLLERFATTMSILIESGVPILYALEIAERSAGSIKMAESIQYIKKNVKEGRSMAAPMEKSEFFTPMVVQMVAIGEEIGELSNMLKRIAKFYQEYLEVFVTRLAAIFEPLMVVFMGIIIGAMVISIFLPIFSLANIKSTG